MRVTIALTLACVLAAGAGVACQQSAFEYRMAFGSCFRHQRLFRTSEIFDRVYDDRPDSFVWLGDFAYLDKVGFSKEGYGFQHSPIEEVKRRFEDSYNDPHYKKVRESTTIYGIWDDHDSGINNSDKSNVQKEEVRQLFLNYMNEPLDSSRRQRKGGMYASYYVDPGKFIKLILLDVRYDRDALTDSKVPFADKTLLGDEQEAWVNKEIKESEAHFTLIGLGNQISHDDRPLIEIIFPKTRRNLFTIHNPKTRVIFLSGDVHFGEILTDNCTKHFHGHNLYEFTSSGLSHSMNDFGGPRFGEDVLNFLLPDTFSTKADRFLDLNYATLDFVINPANMNKSSIEFKLKDINGKVRLNKILQIGQDLPYREIPDIVAFDDCVMARGSRISRMLSNMIYKSYNFKTLIPYILIGLFLALILGLWIAYKIWRCFAGMFKSANREKTE